MSAPDRYRALRWLTAPSAAHGIHTYDDGGWTFHPYAAVAARARGIADHVRGEGHVAVLAEHPPTVLAGLGAAWLGGRAGHVLTQPLTFHDWDGYAALVRRALTLTGSTTVVYGADSASTADRLARTFAGEGIGFVPADDVAVPTDAVANGAAPDGAAPDGALPTGASRGGALPGGRGPIGADADGTPDADRVMIHQLTSGSTGAPRLIRVGAANLEANLAGMADWLGWRDGVDAWASWLPLHHDMGLIGGLLMPAAHDSDLWTATPGQFLRDPSCWVSALDAGHGTVTAAPTFGYAYTAKRIRRPADGVDLSGVRVACVGAEPVSQDVLAGFGERFAGAGFAPRAWAPAYGLAESTLCVSAVTPDEDVRVAVVDDGEPMRLGEAVPVRGVEALGDGDGVRLVGCGRPILAAHVDIVDEDGAVLPDGHLGEIVVGGPSVARVGDGGTGTGNRHATGDSGLLLDGELFVLGRIGDGIKVRGEFVDCEGLEKRVAAALGRSPERVALALGRTAADVGAVLLVRDEPEPDARERAEAQLRVALGATAEVTVVAVDGSDIPKTSSGKVRRREIWRRWGPERTAAAVAERS